MSILTVDNVSVKAWGAQLLNNISFHVEKGEIISIIGPNGAGKTTLMNALLDAGMNTSNPNGQYQLTGDIALCGHRVSNNTVSGKSSTWKAKDRARHVALLPQLSLLNFPYTVHEVVELSRIPHSTGMKVDQEIIHAALDALDITHLKQRFYTQLSGGEKQRVQLARVMAQIWRSEDAAQRLLLLDEPTSSLDLGHQQQLMNGVRMFANEGVAVVIVVHDVNLVAHYSDRVLALSCGEMVAEGVPKETITPELMQALYGVDVDVIAHPVNGQPVITYR